MIYQAGEYFLISGPLQREPEYKNVGAKNVPVCNFSVIVSRGDEEKGTRTQYANCTAWRDAGDSLKGQRKGDSVFAVAKKNRYTNQAGKTYENYIVDFVAPSVYRGDRFATEDPVSAFMEADEDSGPF